MENKMRCGDSRLRFFGGLDGDVPMTVPSTRYLDTLERMAREWSESHDALAFVAIGTTNGLELARPKPIPRHGYAPRRQYRYG